MPQPDDPHSLYVPLFESLDAVGFGEHENPRHFNTGTLFWSLTRLFGCYERVMSVIDLSRDERPFLDTDLENFIIRFRIVLNDIAYVIWQLLPKNARGLKGPRGGTHPKNREMSMFPLAEYLIANESTYPELSVAFSNAAPWMTRLKNDRDNVIHYKSKAVIFEGDLPLFALLGAAGTERTEPTPDGGQRLVLQSIMEFVNGQMLALHQFMHDQPCRRRQGSRSAFWPQVCPSRLGPPHHLSRNLPLQAEKCAITLRSRRPVRKANVGWVEQRDTRLGIVGYRYAQPSYYEHFIPRAITIRALRAKRVPRHSCLARQESTKTTRLAAL